MSPEGKLFLVTAGPSHEIRSEVERVGGMQYIVKNYGFRSGDIFSFFDDKDHLHEIAKKIFKNVEVGVITESYSTTTLQFLYLLAK